MVDCGFGLRECVARLQKQGRSPEQITGILVTHEHGDHLGGVFRLARKYGVPVWLTHGTRAACRESEAGLDLRVIDSHRAFAVGQFDVQPFPVPHDAREPVQYTFSGGGRRLGVLTDAGEVTSHMCDVLSGCDGLVLEFNHDAGMLARSAYPAALKRRIAGRYGHLENREAVRLLSGIDCSRLQHLVAAHLSESNNSPELVMAAISEAIACPPFAVGVATPDSGFGWRCLA